MPSRTRVLADAIVAPILVRRIDVPVSQVKLLTQHERYAYYLLGHFFNELMFLQKLLHFAIPKHDDSRQLRQLPEYGQLMFIARIAAGKLWEAKRALEERDLSRVIEASFLTLAQNSKQSLIAWKRRIAKAKWPELLRNGHSFHYPKYSQWSQLVQTDPTWVDDQILLVTLSQDFAPFGNRTTGMMKAR